jgi:two-component system LytT family response regulator
MIHTILADDEVLARQKLRQLLRDEPEIEIIGEGASAGETIELVHATKPDLLFLDIRMPGLDGFDIIGRLSACKDLAMPRVVFTTAHDGYALRAFEIHALDYLLKPFSSERLHSAVLRATEQICATKQGAVRSSGRGQSSTSYITRIVFRSRGRILFLPVSDIRWIRAEENYVRICTEAEQHLLRETMSHLEEKLDPQMFMRVHRSAIVNLQYLKEVRTEPSGEFTVLLMNGQKVSMSRSYHARIGELSTAFQAQPSALTNGRL